jgi:phospholipase/carboxylesterase/glyoxalase family protein
LRTDELAEFIEAAAAAYGFVPDRVIAVGYSNGANIAASLLLLHPGLLRAAVLFHPMVPVVPDRLPDLSTTPIFIGAGRFDTLVPREETERLVDLFRQAGADVTLHWQAGGHSLALEEVRAAEGWLRRNQFSDGGSGSLSSPD